MTTFRFPLLGSRRTAIERVDMITDEMVFAAAEAGREEMKAWTIVPSPIIGSNAVELHDAYRERPLPIGEDTLPSDATYTVYRCGSREEAMELMTFKAWSAGLIAAMSLRKQEETVQ